MDMFYMDKLLIGNSFPMSLIRREVKCVPIAVEEFREFIADIEIVSFWGHDNTVDGASELLARDLRPKQKRPVLKLSEKNLPVLNNCEFDTVYVVCPEYAVGFRPEINNEFDTKQIKNWQVVKLTWK
jgi:hypothetical protein